MTAECREGDMVVCADGSVGLLIELNPYPKRCTVRFGADGPDREVLNFRRAKGPEIIAAGLSSVGCNQANEGTVVNRDIGHRRTSRQN